MESFIGKKRNTEHKEIENNNQKENKTKKENNKNDDFKNNDDMNKIIDDCFNDFINGNSNKLFENYNLLKQKFYEVVQN